MHADVLQPCRHSPLSGGALYLSLAQPPSQWFYVNVHFVKLVLPIPRRCDPFATQIPRFSAPLFTAFAQAVRLADL